MKGSKEKKIKVDKMEKKVNRYMMKTQRQ